MSFYLDASAILPLILRDSHTEQMSPWIASRVAELIVSDFASLEFSSVVSRQVRTRALTSYEANKAIELFEEWSRQFTLRVAIGSADIRFADQLVRDFATKLAAPDALHLASAINLGATLVTFDQRLAEVAKMRGAKVVTPT